MFQTNFNIIRYTFLILYDNLEQKKSKARSY